MKPLRIKKPLSYLFSFESTFLLFLVAGEFKGTPAFAPIQDVIDVTALFMILNIATGAFVLLKRHFGRNRESGRYNVGFFYLFLWFYLYALSSYLLTPSDPKADRKALEFSIIVPWCFFVSTFILNRPKRVRRFISLLISFALLLSFSSLYRFYSGQLDVRTLAGGLGSGYHRLGRLTGATIVILVVAFPGLKSRRYKAVAMLAIGVALAGLIASAQRAPWVAMPTAIIILVTFFSRGFGKYAGRMPWKHVLSMGLAVGVLTILFLQFSERAQYVLFRWQALIFPSKSNDRLLMYRAAWDLFLRYPLFGVGFGLFSDKTGLYTWRQPHNIYLEVLSELGVLGFVLINMTIFFWVLFYRGALRSNPVILCLIAMFWYYFVNALVSGDITDNRLFLSVAAMLASNTYFCYKSRKYHTGVLPGSASVTCRSNPSQLPG